ncbi:glutathione S-transferase family protein [Methylovirgula sp. 4M-Z18]|uniref:glutathione S-transferase family protein n=1 Tax=Methylovirgula sp. 4M-Z18 TaxID=2293567 RepID=UPI000E2FDD05|nr:glutathione S-transferase family protein [Methylovirgula sp. 4M-Z18]RFB78564.1 glutathione S-transferase family protein [Methylovirgula sp. 4M-Z18]
MQLIGMMDSPYVRRVAISLRLMGIAHEHQQISVFRQMDEFRAINPVIKAPTLVCDDGTTLMESALILDYLEALADPERSLMPKDLAARRRALALIGLGLAACEKSIQIEYERKRPKEFHYEPWVARVTGQLHAAMELLEKAASHANPWLVTPHMCQADVTVAVAWRFVQYIVPDLVRVTSYAGLAAYAGRVEQLPEFVETPLE